ncbi:MAG: hypothetical protein ACRDSL_08015 [Pseudonocardiaceae bacterium]
MTEHTPQDGILQLEELIHAGLHKYIDPASRAAQVGWGAFFTVVHQIRAVLTLHRDRVCFSAGPNRRTIVEYILFLAWLADDGESVVDVLNRSLQNEQKHMATRLSGASLLDQFPEHARQVLAETIATPLAPHPDERLLKPSHLIEEYDSTLKSYYAAESRFSHVSLTSIQFFLKTEDEAIRLTQMPVPEEPISCPEFCLHTLSQALLVFNELLLDHPWTAELARIAEDYGLDTRRPTRKSNTA